MSEYENLPITDNTPHSPNVLKTDLLPDEYLLLQTGINKAHIVHEKSLNKNKVIDEGVAICGRRVKHIDDSRIPVGNCCIDCMEGMNDRMMGYLFDEKNGEYYNPMEEK